MVRPAPGSGERSPEDIADAAHRMDEARRRRVLLDEAPEPVDMDVHGPALAGVVIAPDALEELVAGEDLAGVTEEEGEQLERLRLDRQVRTVAQQPMAGEIHLHPAEIHDRRRRLEGDRLLRAPEERPDPGGQLAQRERLRDVVVRAQLESDDLVEL